MVQEEGLGRVRGRPLRLGTTQGGRRDAIAEQFSNAPDMIGKSSGHGWGTRKAHVLWFAQFLVRETKIVGSPNQIHPGRECIKTTSSVMSLTHFFGQGK